MCTIGALLALSRSGCDRAAKRRSDPCPHGNYLVAPCLKASAASAAGAFVGAPALVRAEVKEIVIGGPAGAAKYFNADVFPSRREGARDQGHLRGHQFADQPAEDAADKDAPKMSVVIMDDPVMLVAAREGLITPITAAGSPNLGKLAAAKSIRTESGPITRSPGRASPTTPMAGRRRRAGRNCMRPKQRAKSSYRR